MPSLLQEEVGIAFAGVSWLIGDFQLWESAQPDIILYSLQQPTLALNQTKQHQVSLTVVRQWQGGVDQMVNGSLSFVTTVLPQLDQAAFEQLKQKWSQELHDRGYSRSQSLRFLPLPMRNLYAQVELDSSIGKVSTPADLSTGETCTFLVDLTQSGAIAWATALEQNKAVPAASLQFTYEYPQQLPEAHAVAQIHGKLAYDALLTVLHRQQNGSYTGTRSEVLAALEEVIQNRQIEVNLTPPLPPEQQQAFLLKTLLENTRQAILDALFITESNHSDSNSVYVLKWKTSADAFDFSFQVSVAGGWTWLQGSIDNRFTDLFADIDSRYRNTVYLERSFPVSITVQGDPLLQTVALSWSADQGIPQTIVFSSAGGKRDTVLTSRNPDAVMIQFQAKLSFTPAKWSPIELKGRATVAQGGNQIVLRPGDLVGRVMFHLLARDGNRIKPAADLSPNDSIVVNVAYKGEHLATPIKVSSRITPIAPVQFTYLRDPQNRPVQLRLSAIGTLNSKLMRVAEQTIRLDETDVYLLLEGDRLQLVSRDSVISEDDPLAQQLLEAGLRPIVSS